mgnify:CR=1 FL=1
MPPTFTIADLVGCVGQELELSVQDLFSEGIETDEDFAFLWSNGETTQSIQVVVQENTTYYSVQVMDLCGNTSEEAEAMVSASIPPAPEFSFEQVEDSVQFIQLTEGIFTNFEWDFGDGSQSNSINPSHGGIVR